jgi:hypothetical protein
MVYNKTVTITKNTVISNPQATKLQIGRGVIKQWTVLFPPGSEWGYIACDEATLVFPDWRYISQPPYELDIYSWNTDTEYDHSFILYVAIVPLWTEYPYSPQYKKLLLRELLVM